VNPQIQLVALQEIRWKGYGLLKKDKYSIFYSCSPNTTGLAATGFIIQKSAMSKVLGFEQISDRICKSRVKGKFHNITLINIMLQQKIKKRMLKNNFTRNCSELIIEYQNIDVIIIPGDMNAKLGKEEAFSQVEGRYYLHESSKENGELAANYAISNDMFLISTNFQHKKIHIGTWISPDHQTVNQIHHVMVSKGKMRLIHDVRSNRGYNCEFDHFLVQIKVKQKLITVKNRQTQTHKWDRQSLNQQVKISKYHKYLQLMLQEIKEETDINKDRRISNRRY
jgi:hypothetical protein